MFWMTTDDTPPDSVGVPGEPVKGALTVTELIVNPVTESLCDPQVEFPSGDTFLNCTAIVTPLPVLTVASALRTKSFSGGAASPDNGIASAINATHQRASIESRFMAPPNRIEADEYRECESPTSGAATTSRRE